MTGPGLKANPSGWAAQAGSPQPCTLTQVSHETRPISASPLVLGTPYDVGYAGCSPTQIGSRCVVCQAPPNLDRTVSRCPRQEPAHA
jgi:hypothetical protein